MSRRPFSLMLSFGVGRPDRRFGNEDGLGHSRQREQFQSKEDDELHQQGPKPADQLQHNAVLINPMPYIQ